MTYFVLGILAVLFSAGNVNRFVTESVTLRNCTTKHSFGSILFAIALSLFWPLVLAIGEYGDRYTKDEI